MGARLFMAPALIVSIVVGACSKPVQEAGDGRSLVQRSAERDISLPGGADSASAVVSDLEAGRPVAEAPRPDRPASRSTRRSGPKTALAALEQAPKLSTASSSAEAPVAVLAVAPVAPEQVESVVYTGGGSLQTDEEGWTDPAPINRLPSGPTVIIRGGRGGVDDDCDLHRPGIRRFGGGGAAVHSLVPQIGIRRRGR